MTPGVVGAGAGVSAAGRSGAWEDLLEEKPWGARGAGDPGQCSFAPAQVRGLSSGTGTGQGPASPGRHLPLGSSLERQVNVTA